MSLSLAPAAGSSKVAGTAAGDLAGLRQRAAALLPDLRAGAADRERERQLPHALVRRIAAEGLYTFRIPRAYGGSGTTVQEVIRFVMDVAAADSNVAQALRPGFLFIENLLSGGDEASRQRWFPRYLAGAVVANAGWERGGANGAISSVLVREAGHYRVSGTKYYSTGALYADWIQAAALDESGAEVRFIVPSDRDGVERVDDFDAMGQRLTASGTTLLRNVRVDEEDLIPSPLFRDGQARRTIVTPFAQLFLGAVEAGIARNALDDAVLFARHHARPIKHSSASRSVEDPYVVGAVGEISAQAFAAEAVVLRAAAAIDHAWEAGLSHDAVLQASIDVAQAQYIAANAALKAAERVFDVGSASATARSHNLDRHWRNARTVANHNPRDWKAAAVGAFRLTGAEPPLSGLF
ncbi:acyl-CoA dehydrogenase family protein [Kerstersia sp.]|uniref:acyl-CoA dehydrogenase family protein n=1 Tax=Kerstersia sp. TaxID=1930783 RepID=UPI003F8E1BFF